MWFMSMSNSLFYCTLIVDKIGIRSETNSSHLVLIEANHHAETRSSRQRRLNSIPLFISDYEHWNRMYHRAFFRSTNYYSYFVYPTLSLSLSLSLTHTHTHKHRRRAYVHTHHVCVDFCIYICAYVCLYVFMCVCVCVCVHDHPTFQIIDWLSRFHICRSV